MDGEESVQDTSCSLFLPSSCSFCCSLACGYISVSAFIFLMVFPCVSPRRVSLPWIDAFAFKSYPILCKGEVPSPRSGHIHRFWGSGHSHIFLRLPSYHCICSATHPLYIASWDAHCLEWISHQPMQQPWWLLVAPFGSEVKWDEAQGQEISWPEMGVGSEGVRGTEINKGDLTNFWGKTSNN